MVQSMFYVNPATGNDRGAGNQYSPFKTLTRALQQLSSTTIQLAAGIYDRASGESFPLIVPAGVTVLGNESGKGKGIVIEGSGSYFSRSFGRQNITIVLADDAQLRGVTVTNRAGRGTAVWIESTAPVVANNTFANSAREGLFATGTAHPTIEGNLFIQNNANGMSIARNGKGEIRGNVCQDTGYGISIRDDAAPVVLDNRIFTNRSGMVVSDRSRPVLRNNTIENNSEDGLVVIGDAIADLGSPQDNGGNILRGNGQYDLHNATRNKLISVGNQINPTRVKGSIDFVAADLPIAPTPSPTPSPTPTPIPTPPPRETGLTDIAGHWAEVFIAAMVSKGFISGFPDRTFRPDRSITRAEYAALIAKTFPLPFQRSEIYFWDVDPGFWAAGAIGQASRMGFISGFPDGSFRPQQNLTRVQAIVSLVNGLGLTGGNSNLLFTYRDRVQIPSYATDEVATATQRWMVVNYPQKNILNPMLDSTRAEVSAFIYQALVATNKAPRISSPYIVEPDF
ncbi:MAG: DUF1565 domain-containing protein [Hormoscilla sp.]